MNCLRATAYKSGFLERRIAILTLIALLAPFQLHGQCPPAADSDKSSQSGPQNSTAGTPQFYDEPQFTVAGVADATNLGAHGSDTVVRTKEALAKDTVSLSRQAPPDQSAASATPAKKSLRDRTYDLAIADASAGRYQDSRTKIRALLARQDIALQEQAELHHLLGDVEENLNNPLPAVRAYQRAAELSASERHFFDWGAELLAHRAAEPAIEVFSKGNRQFPRSVRMLVGLGVAYYARGSYGQAVQCLCQASDLNPSDPTAYLFMGKIQNAETLPSDALLERLARFVRLQPDNALANYYYAAALWKHSNTQDAKTSAQVESLLEKAVHLDPKLGLAHLQLGILYSDRGDFPKAISAYQQAIAASPQLEEPHYRLAQAYRRAGDKAKAQQELQLYQQLSKKAAELVERERHEIQQFVLAMRDTQPASPPPQKP
ncbi:MAG: tetratricopeptide repeat protein [Terriglobales bacterium]